MAANCWRRPRMGSRPKGMDVNEDRSIGTAGRVIMFGAALVVLIAGMRAAETILVPFLVLACCWRCR